MQLETIFTAVEVHSGDLLDPMEPSVEAGSVQARRVSGGSGIPGVFEVALQRLEQRVSSSVVHQRQQALVGPVHGLSGQVRQC